MTPTTTCPICTMVKNEDNVICEDCNTKGLIEHGIQILKNQELSKKWLKITEDPNWVKGTREFSELYEIVERLNEEFEYYDIAFKKHKDIDDFKIAQVLQKILRKEKPQRITSTKEGRKFLGDFEATA